MSPRCGLLFTYCIFAIKISSLWDFLAPEERNFCRRKFKNYKRLQRSDIYSDSSVFQTQMIASKIYNQTLNTTLTPEASGGAASFFADVAKRNQQKRPA